MKKVVFLVLFLVIFLFGCSQELTLQEVCENGDGDWVTLSDDCVDGCDYIRSDGAMECSEAMTDGCDCGEESCWNGEACEPN